jgi:hypothetical protein
MDKAFKSHTAQADLAAKHEIFDLMIPSNAYSSARAEVYAAEGGADKAMRRTEHIDHATSGSSEKASEKV